MQSGMGVDDVRTVPDLTFTKAVIIYHEAMLPILQKSEIIKAFKDWDLDVQFRGQDYLNFRQAMWSQSHRKD